MIRVVSRDPVRNTINTAGGHVMFSHVTNQEVLPAIPFKTSDTLMFSLFLQP